MYSMLPRAVGRSAFWWVVYVEMREMSTGSFIFARNASEDIRRPKGFDSP